jgi:pyruvate dehydrogenase E1 component
MIYEEQKESLPDRDPEETREWLESLEAAAARDRGRAELLVYRLVKRARQLQLALPPTTQTPNVNSIAPEDEPIFPGDEELERRIRRLVRWNAVAMVIRANRHFEGLGGHLSTYASAATLYEVGYNHFFRGQDQDGIGDHVFLQGHAAPGIYARMFLLGRLTEAELDRFRREAGEGGGLSSYPHPRLMPGVWQFPTVSMGIGPLNAVYLARFQRYLHARGIADTSRSRVWCFLGDGETDEPESLAGLSLAAREGLDNLTFVVNCNLQRLDGPVRGNGKIIQELESVFRGAGWNVIKVIWGREWDPLLARDHEGVLREKMGATCDGEYQRLATESGAIIRERFFGPDPRLGALVEGLSDGELRKLRRGGHDYRKVYAAFKTATLARGVPTVILAKTVKGWTLGDAVEGRNVTHQVKKLSEKELRAFRDRLHLPIPDAALAELPPYFHPGMKSEEVEYMIERRRALEGFVPRRRLSRGGLPPPAGTVFDEFRAGTGEKLEASTTMAFARMLRLLMKDPALGARVVPIVPDEARTFGMDPLFTEFKIYAPHGQRYTPVDAEFVLSYREAKDGQILEEGITEAGALASFTAAATSASVTGQPMLPFFIFYSMFGFQRVMDLIWALGDARGRGFLLGATAGRTTLAGEGLQHLDGHSPLLAAAVPSCRVYDPAFAYELAAVLEEGIRRMMVLGEEVFYYLTLYNEAYPMPAEPAPAEATREGILRGLYRYRAAAREGKPVQLLGSGPILREALGAAELLGERFGIAAEVWSATSYVELRREALATARWNRLHPEEPPRVPYVARQLEEGRGPIVAASDYLAALPDGIARFLPAGRGFVSLGTDGWGCSDTRAALRARFEVNAAQIAFAAISALCREGAVDRELALRARAELGIDPEAAGALGAFDPAE